MQRFDRIAIVSGLGAGLNVIAALTAAPLHGDALGMLLAIFAASVVTAVLSLWKLKDTLRATFEMAGFQQGEPEQGHQAMLQRVRRFSVSVWYLVLLEPVVRDRSEVYFLGRYSRIADVATYAIAFVLVTKICAAASSVTSNLAPLAADAISGSEPEQVGIPFLRSLRYIHALLILVCILGIGLSKPVVLALYGRQYLTN
jgi:O-antigen/teichoic acid export membrane protein